MPKKEDQISIKTVNRILNEYQFKRKIPSFSVKERNTFAAMALRYIWSKMLTEIISNTNTIFAFIDEAAVVFGRSKKKARGFYSVTPLVNKPLTAKKMTIFVAIIPGFGTVYKWYDKSVKGHQYAKFLREISFIFRNNIGNPSSQIVIVQDYCPIHKTLEVNTEIERNKLNVFNIIPYSPQLNLLAENYFAQLKFHVLYDFTALPNEEINRSYIKEHIIPPYKILIMKQWEATTEQHYDSHSTARIFGAGKNVLDLCIAGETLNGQHIHQTTNLNVMKLRQNVNGTKKLI